MREDVDSWTPCYHVSALCDRACRRGAGCNRRVGGAALSGSYDSTIRRSNRWVASPLFSFLPSSHDKQPIAHLMLSLSLSRSLSLCGRRQRSISPSLPTRCMTKCPLYSADRRGPLKMGCIRTGREAQPAQREERRRHHHSKQRHTAQPTPPHTTHTPLLPPCSLPSRQRRELRRARASLAPTNTPHAVVILRIIATDGRYAGNVGTIPTQPSCSQRAARPDARWTPSAALRAGSCVRS